jgi:hypothetical protein
VIKTGKKRTFKTGKLTMTKQPAGKMSSFSTQVAIITGAASGLGLVIAHKLLNEGASVGLFDLNEKALNEEFVGNLDKEELIGLDVLITNLLPQNQPICHTAD